MKIGIVWLSYTGNTESIANQLKEKLRPDHEVKLMKLETIPNDPEAQTFTLKEVPAIDEFDALIIGCPVHGFSPAKGMKLWLDAVPALKSKRVIGYVTQYFPFAWMGGTGTLNNLRKYVEAKQGQWIHGFTINWHRKNQPEQVARLLNQIKIDIEKLDK